MGDTLVGWRPRPLPPREPLRGRWVALEPLDPARHSGQLFEALAEPSLWTYLFAGPFPSAAALREYLVLSCTGEDPQLHVISVDGAARGLAALMRIDSASGVLEIGHICLGPGLSRTRASTEALYLLMKRTFDELGYRRCEWKCDALNAPSRAAAERLGFRFEGIFRQAIVNKGRNRDTAWYSVIDSEWPALREAIGRWLEPQNFDSAGFQRARLDELRTRRAGG